MHCIQLVHSFHDGTSKITKRIADLHSVAAVTQLRRPKVKRIRCWIREIFQSLDRYGAFETLFNVLGNDRELFFRYIRMTPERLDHFLSLKREQIEKKDTRFCKSVPAVERLAITSRYLAPGETKQSL